MITEVLLFRYARGVSSGEGGGLVVQAFGGYKQSVRRILVMRGVLVMDLKRMWFLQVSEDFFLWKPDNSHRNRINERNGIDKKAKSE